jgi:regulator of sigma E protease
MSEFFGSIWWYLVVIAVLVTFHEFGHFWVARRCGVQVLKFSIGFGKSLWSRTGRDGTVYTIGAIPLGGYVLMLDERAEDVPPELRHRAHNNKSNLQKIAISAAGPGFNFVLALIAFWVMFTIGRPDYQPVIGEAGGLAREAGMVAGSRILAVDGEAQSSYTKVIAAIHEDAIYRRDATLAVREPGGGERTIVLPLSRIPAEFDDSQLVRHIGVYPQQRAVIGEVLADGGAAAAGIRAGDELLALNGIAVADFDAFRRLLVEQATIDPDVEVTLLRDGQRLRIDATARATRVESGKTEYLLGIRPAALRRDAIERYGPLEAIPAAARETWATTVKTVVFLRDIVTGLLSPRYLSGPITIGRVANAVAEQGLAQFLGLIAALSVGIGILNLLPIPILDGGHILSYLIESLKGSPLSERAVIAGQYVGLGLLACLIGLAVFNDVAHW